jgi:hypothetical protein
MLGSNPVVANVIYVFVSLSGFDFLPSSNFLIMTLKINELHFVKKLDRNHFFLFYNPFQKTDIYFNVGVHMGFSFMF